MYDVQQSEDVNSESVHRNEKAVGSYETYGLQLCWITVNLGIL